MTKQARNRGDWIDRFARSVYGRGWTPKGIADRLREAIVQEVRRLNRNKNKRKPKRVRFLV